jgi:hypothetical protein
VPRDLDEGHRPDREEDGRGATVEHRCGDDEDVGERRSSNRDALDRHRNGFGEDRGDEQREQSDELLETGARAREDPTGDTGCGGAAE